MKRQQHYEVRHTAHDTVPSALLNPGCARGLTLELSPQAKTITPARHRAFDVAGDVLVIVRGDAWVGEPEIRHTVLPVKVNIINNHDSPIRIRYSDVVLLGVSENRCEVIPVFNIEKETEETVKRSDTTRIFSPRFQYRGFYIDPLESSERYPSLFTWNQNKWISQAVPRGGTSSSCAP